MVDHLEFARSLALKAGKIVKEGYYAELLVETKGELDFVTKIDREAEKEIRKEVERTFPTHGFIGEESGTTKKNAEYAWVVDPLDGTTNFIHKIPFFGVSIALKRTGETIVGVVYNPMTDEMFYAEKGKGAYMNGKQLKIKKPNKFEKWFMAHCFRDTTKHEEAERIIFDAFFYQTARTAKLGSASLELCYAASSRVDAYIGLSLKEWDYAAGNLIVKEAGGETILSELVGKHIVIAGHHEAVHLIMSKILPHNHYDERHEIG
jgi:myo-inositol-1(or 4)-monophosphatase